jgi:hypothetical protein
MTCVLLLITAWPIGHIRAENTKPRQSIFGREKSETFMRCDSLFSFRLVRDKLILTAGHCTDPIVYVHNEIRVFDALSLKEAWRDTGNCLSYTCSSGKNPHIVIRDHARAMGFDTIRVFNLNGTPLFEETFGLLEPSPNGKYFLRSYGEHDAGSWSVFDQTGKETFSVPMDSAYDAMALNDTLAAFAFLDRIRFVDVRSGSTLKNLCLPDNIKMVYFPVAMPPEGGQMVWYVMDSLLRITPRLEMGWEFHVDGPTVHAAMSEEGDLFAICYQRLAGVIMSVYSTDKPELLWSDTLANSNYPYLTFQDGWITLTSRMGGYTADGSYLRDMTTFFYRIGSKGNLLGRESMPGMVYTLRLTGGYRTFSRTHNDQNKITVTDWQAAE